MKSLRNFATIGALVIGSFVGVANATPIVVFEQPLNIWNEGVSADFAANRELGRAWIEVGLSTRSLGSEPSTPEVIRKTVEGLYYDSARKQVLYRTGTETIVCAEDASSLWTTYLKSTGQCLLTSRTEQRQIDDGFSIREQSVTKIVFETRTSPASQHAAAGNAMTPDAAVVK